MVDRFSPEVRSNIMSQIKGKNTSIKVMVFKFLKGEGIYFQKHYTRVIGNPDIALLRKKKAVFIDGDFWHGHTFEKRKDNLPAYWQAKIIRNVKRDQRTRRSLREHGWQVLRIWENDLFKKNREATLQRLKEFLTK